MPSDLPFDIETHITDRRGGVQYVAVRDGDELGIGRYVPGDVPRRRQVAVIWTKNEALQNGRALTVDEVADALELAETEARASIEEQSETDNELKPAQPDEIEIASFVDDGLIVELAWSHESGKPDLISYDRQACCVSRSESVSMPAGLLVPPNCSIGLLTPGSPIPGSVLLPSEHDESGVDEDRLRHDIEAFIRSYVELTDAATKLCVEYVLLSWVHDDFDTLPYLAFRTADYGRGKSRALGTVGALSYRGILCGGGSTAAATLRLLDLFGGTLIADEFDQRDSELASELTRILNQGFEQNRPLVRCVGDANAPKAFRCFSPKLFAIRKGFADDATESRMISVRMQQRTRQDIPISLNRREFDRRALSLRNRLLAWRFANLGKITVDLAHVDPRLEDRCNQIGLPLFAVARTAEGRARISSALLEQQVSVAADRSDSWAYAVFEAALAIAQPGGTVFAGTVAVEVNRRRAEEEGVDPDKLRKPISPHKVGSLLRTELEFEQRPRVAKGFPYVMSPDRVTQLQNRFGVPPSGSTPSTQVHPAPSTPPETTLFDTENDDPALGVHSVLPDGSVGTATDGVHDGQFVASSNANPGPGTANSEDDEFGKVAPAAAPESTPSTEVHPPEKSSPDTTPVSLVPSNWTADAYADHLTKKASKCESQNPELAERHRAKAAQIRTAVTHE